MLINPNAVERLKAVTAYNYWPNTTHEQRNGLARMFVEEAGKLLDQKAESTVKHVVDLYSKDEISYERYIELIEQISIEEAERGAAQGGAYARNRVFEFAQKALDRAKDQAHALSLSDAKRQYEIEKQKSEEIIKQVVQQSVASLETLTEQQEADLVILAQQQKDALLLNQENITAHTKAEIDQVISRQLQEERERREQEIREQEDKRPAREAAQRALERVALFEKKAQGHKRMKKGVVGLGVVLLLSLLIFLLFFPLPGWLTVLLFIASLSIIVIAYFWKSTIPEDKLAEHKRQIVLFQTKGGDYAPLSEEERCALLVQRTG